ncbi:MAG: ribosome assembly cofactor RimP [Draconibacterium sp.]|nr:ribosome assembly cofactor RimP [Draconibacterium sp.]
MIDKRQIVSLVNEQLEDKMFLVDIKVNERNVIDVFVDSFDGLPISKCVAISRHVEHSLDREEEDFELHVSSPGLTEGFKVKEQYIKYKGRAIEVVPEEGKKLEGILLEVGEDDFVLETSTREKVEGHKKKQLIVKKHILKYDEIKSAKAVISFK